MKKLFLVKLLVNPRFTPTASNWSSIKNEKYYKGSYYYFKYDEQLLKDTNSFSARTISSQSLAEAGHMAAHSAI